ncbi:hypothetical protein, partial [Streptomyces tricolor]
GRPGSHHRAPTGPKLNPTLPSARWYAPEGAGRNADPSAVARALHILDHQAVRGGGATSGAHGR